MNLALALAGVDATLFDAAHEAASTAALSAAISAATGVPAAAVSVRRVRDVSNPAAPVVLYINPQYAGDAFPARRRLQQRRLPGGAATVSVDAQILQANNSDAAALSAKLASGTTFASIVQGALTGSPFAGAQVAASVQPYPVAGSGAPAASGAAGATLAVGAAAGAVIVLIAGAVFMYRAKRLRDTAVAPEADPGSAAAAAAAAPQLPAVAKRGRAAAVAPGAASEASAAPAAAAAAAAATAAAAAASTTAAAVVETAALAPQLPAAVDGQEWRTFNRVYLTVADMDFLVALGALDADGKRVGARRATAEARARFSAIVLEKLIAFGVLL